MTEVTFDSEDNPVFPEPTAQDLKIERDRAFDMAHPKGWVWSEEKVSHVPPIDPPDSKYPYLWNEDTLTWDAFPGYPRDN